MQEYSNSSSDDDDTDIVMPHNPDFSSKTYKVFGEPLPFQYNDTKLPNIVTFGGLHCKEWEEGIILAPDEHASHDDLGFVRILTHIRKLKMPDKSRKAWKTVLTHSQARARTLKENTKLIAIHQTQVNSKAMFGTMVVTAEKILMVRPGELSMLDDPESEPEGAMILKVPLPFKLLFLVSFALVSNECRMLDQLIVCST